MLSDQQQLLLKMAVKTTDLLTKERQEAVDQAIRLVKMMTPNAFYPDVPHNKPTKEMIERIFFDEPVQLPIGNYTEFIVPYTNGPEQVTRFKNRDKKYYAGGK